jgi:nucleoredoxin
MLYDEINEESQVLEVIFMSCDVQQSAFESYYDEMPWMSLPFKDQRIQMLCNEFKVKAVPHLSALDKYGNVLDKNCIIKVIEDGP